MVESSLRSLRDEKHPSKAKMIFLDLTCSLGPKRLSWITSLTLSNKITAVDHENWLELKEMASTMAHLTKVLINNTSLRAKYNMHHFCRANLLNKLGDEVTDISIFTHGIVVSSVIRGDALEDMWPTTTAVVPCNEGIIRTQDEYSRKAPCPSGCEGSAVRSEETVGQDQILS